mmetsp:Transcript_75153/g.147529  ORF Transcript_75153/g.147529 Transcript_75153/m.147529 type:complete len:104 (-) Transcript_75153:47-358(-)
MRLGSARNASAAGRSAQSRWAFNLVLDAEGPEQPLDRVGQPIDNASAEHIVQEGRVHAIQDRPNLAFANVACAAQQDQDPAPTANFVLHVGVVVEHVENSAPE